MYASTKIALLVSLHKVKLREDKRGYRLKVDALTRKGDEGRGKAAICLGEVPNNF